jgi:hypothetical protein
MQDKNNLSEIKGTLNFFLNQLLVVLVYLINGKNDSASEILFWDLSHPSMSLLVILMELKVIYFCLLGIPGHLPHSS